MEGYYIGNIVVSLMGNLKKMEVLKWRGLKSQGPRVIYMHVHVDFQYYYYSTRLATSKSPVKRLNYGRFYYAVLFNDIHYNPVVTTGGNDTAAVTNGKLSVSRCQITHLFS